MSDGFRVAALAPALAARNELGTLAAPSDANLVGRDTSSDKDQADRGHVQLKRDAEIAAGAASNALSKYLAARSLIGRDTDGGEDEADTHCGISKREAAAAAAEAATAYEKYARSLEN